MKVIHWGTPDSEDVMLPSCNRGLLSAYAQIVSAADFSQHEGAANMCQRCVKLAKLQADKLARQPKLRTDSERYAELRKLVECWQKNLGQAYKDALIQWKHR